MYQRLLALTASLALAAGRGVEVTPETPEFLRTCHRKDPHLFECVKRSVESLRPHLKSGIPELDIPPCEPLSLPKIELSQASGPVSIKSTYTDIKVWGGTEFLLKSFKIDYDKDRVKLRLYIPRLEMQSQYKMEGKILLLPIVGQGAAFGNYTDIDVVTVAQGERYNDPRTGKRHFRVLDLYSDFDVGHASVRLDNLFNGDETLADAMNLFINDNWRIIAAEMKPALEATTSKLFKSFANKLYAKYPIDTLLPP